MEVLTLPTAVRNRTPERPVVSIVILSKNGGELFKRLIRAVYSQISQFSYEVIIVDSDSTDGTLEFLKGYPVNLLRVSPDDFCFGLTRDFGFKQAKGDFVVTVSQDVIPKGNFWLQHIVEPLAKGKADLVQGHIEVPKDRDIFFWERKNNFYFTQETKDFRKSYGNIRVSCINLAITKKVWEDNHFGYMPMSEDKMLQKKLYSKGYRMVVERDATVYHGHTYDLSSLIKRCENEGLGWKYVGVKYSFIQMLKDLIQKKWLYGELVKGLSNGEIKNPAEVLFPFVRPVFLYKGNILNRGYKF